CSSFYWHAVTASPRCAIARRARVTELIRRRASTIKRYCILPIEVAMLQSVDVPQDIASRRTPDSVSQVFIVDDDISVRESLQALIGASGWHAHAFASAREFLQCPRGPAPACLVLDVGLPDVGGLDVQELIASASVPIPIIFISGDADVVTAVRAMQAG